MDDLRNEIKLLKSDNYRPIKWKKVISKKTGYSDSYVEKVFDNNCYNQKIALAIINLFYSEKRKLQKQIEIAKFT